MKKNTIISVNNLCKSYDFNVVLDNLNFKVNEGSVIGLLGKNGAGKTTLLQTLVGLIQAGSGECHLFSQDSWNLTGKVKQKIGYVAQQPDLIPWMTIGDYIDYIKSFYGQWNDEKVASLLNAWELYPIEIVNSLSVGQKQKLSIIVAMGHEPELLILDEPVSSLDPVARRQFIQELIEFNADLGKTILFSTHIVSDIERVAAEVLILKDGSNYYQGDLDTLKEKIVKIHITSEQNLPLDLMISGLISIKQSANTAVAVVSDFSKVDVIQLKERLNATISVEMMSLEDIFLEVHA